MHDLVPNWPELQQFLSCVRETFSGVDGRSLFGEKRHDSWSLKPRRNGIRGAAGDVAKKQRECVHALGEIPLYSILHRQGRNRDRKLAKRADRKVLDRCPTRVPKKPILISRC